MTNSHDGMAPEFCEGPVRTCANILNTYLTQIITFDEFAHTIMCSLVMIEQGCWDQCLGTMTEDLKGRFGNYLHDFLIPVDFIPCPRIYMVGSPSDDEVREKQIEMRPTYVALYKKVTGK